MEGDRPVEVERLKDFAKQVFGALQGAVTAGMVHLGDRLGLYRALAEGGPATSAELAGAHAGSTSAGCASGCASRPPRSLLEWDAGRALRALARGPRGARRRAPSRVRRGHVLAAAADARHCSSGCARPSAAGSAFPTTPSDPRARAASSGASRRGCAPSWSRSRSAEPRRRARAPRARRAVADVGCGAGVALLELARRSRAREFHGYELSRHALARAEENRAEAGLANVALPRGPRRGAPRRAGLRPRALASTACTT